MSLRTGTRFGGHASRGRCTSVATLAVVGLVAATVVGAPAAAAPSPPSPSATTTPAPQDPSAQDEAALKAAQASGQPVEILARRTNDTEVYREPSGHFSVVQHAEPVRIRNGQRWVDIDLTLVRHPDGTVRPAAAPVAVTLSGGGTGPFARLDSEGTRLALSWPDHPLPAPSLSGSTATYANVLPDVDLQVTATTAGFSEIFVVKTPKAAQSAALAALKLGFVTEGVTVQADPGANTLTGVNRNGEVVFHTGTPMMWGSAPRPTVPKAPAGTRAQRQDEPAAPALHSELGLRVGKNDLTIIPDAALRTAGPEAFPISIDPEVTAAGHAGNWTTVVSGRFSDNKHWGTGLPAADNAANGNVKVGRVPGLNVVARSYFQMGIKHVKDKIIVSAEFLINATHAWNCASRPPMQLSLTGAISPNTTWDRQPTWNAGEARHPVAAPCPTGTYKYNVSDLVQVAANRGDDALFVGLRAQDENNEQHWRRFRADGKGPTIRITYKNQPPPPVNHPPAAPAGLSSPSAPTCGSSDNPVRVGAGDLRFTARLTDPDADTVNGFLDLWGANGHHPAAPTSGNVPSGTTASWTVPSGALQQNVVYGYDARVVDTKGAWGPWNAPRCYLVQDITPPDRPPVVTSPEYPADPDHAYGSVGRTGTFTMDRDGVADVSYFLYGSQDPPAMRADAGPNGTATVNITPTTPAVNIFYARSVDIAGNRGPVRRYTFNVASGTFPVGYWRFNERAGTTAADIDGRHDVTVTGGNWVPGRPGDTGRAYQFDGADDHAQTSGPVMDTTKSFSIAAWAKLQSNGSNPGLQTVVAPVGNQRSPFSIVYNNGTRRWELGLRATDASNAADPGRSALVSDVVDRGSWYHLAASYDGGTRQARLYVNGVLVDTRSHAISWNAAGPLQIGRSKNDGAFGDHFGGLIDDVQVWDRVAQPDEVLGIAFEGETSKIGATATSPGPPCRPNQTPDKAVDGRIVDDSKWCTGDVHGRVLRLELATDTTLRAVAVRHAGAGGETHDYNSRDFDIETSFNGADWNRIGTYRGNTGAHTVLTLAQPVRASFVRLVVHTPAQINDNAARIFEFEVYGSPWVIGNAALGMPATSATASCDASQSADRLTDGVVTVAAGWCATQIPATAQVDLGSTRGIRWVVLRHAEAGGGSANQNTRGYEVQTSFNGNTWTTIADVRSNSQAVSGHAQDLHLGARYVRVVIADPAQNGETSARLPELEVYAPQ